jgi:class 3 adenylate cyclase
VAKLPNGTVTVLFRDIEGSTRLLARLRGRYLAVLAEHHRVLRAARSMRGLAFAGPLLVVRRE